MDRFSGCDNQETWNLLVTERKCLIIDDAGIAQDLNSFLAYLPNSVMGLNHTKYTEMKAQGHNS